MSSLFRPEAIEARHRRLSGDVLLATSPSFKVVAGVVCVVAISAFAFVATATYERRETVTGWLTPQKGMIRVLARQGGQVESIDVDDGALVRTGQTIATLKLSNDLAEGDSGASLALDLQREADANAEKASADLRKLTTERTQLQDRRQIIMREAPLLRRRVQLHQERLDLARGEFDKATQLANQGYLPRRELASRRDAMLAAEDNLAAARSAIFDAERELNTLDGQLNGLTADVGSALATTAATRAALAQRQTTTTAQSRYVSTSPVTGRVVALSVHQGAEMAAGATVAVISPQGSALEAEVFVPSRAAGFIEKGQAVRVMYQAYPFQKFGSARGVITTISSTVLSPSEVSAPGVDVKEPVFVVRVRLAKAVIDAYGKTLPLRPGMLVDADIVLDRRTLFEWLLDPLYAAGRRH